MSTLRCLDLCCGAGGASMGLHRAGFDVTGVDINPQPHYPFRFVQADALTYPLEGFDFVWASPPCQGYSRMRYLPWLAGRNWPQLIPALRARLEAVGVPYIMENVADAAPELHAGVLLCGQMFNLKVYRHRLFESNVLLWGLPHARHTEVIGAGRMLNDRAQPSASGMVSLLSKGQYDPMTVMGIDWMTRDELSQAIPPAYSEYLARQLLPALERTAA